MQNRFHAYIQVDESDCYDERTKIPVRSLPADIVESVR